MRKLAVRLAGRHPLWFGALWGGLVGVLWGALLSLGQPSEAQPGQVFEAPADAAKVIERVQAALIDGQALRDYYDVQPTRAEITAQDIINVLPKLASFGESTAFKLFLFAPYDSLTDLARLKYYDRNLDERWVLSESQLALLFMLYDLAP